MHLILMAVIFAASAQAQTTPVDVRIQSVHSTPPYLVAEGELEFQLFVNVEKNKEVSGVTVTAQLPEGVTPTLVFTDADGWCAFAGNLITCNYPKLGFVGDGHTTDHDAFIRVRARPVVVGSFTFSASVSANEPDQNLSNNSTAQSVMVDFIPRAKSRKRVRIL